MSSIKGNTTNSIEMSSRDRSALVDSKNMLSEEKRSFGIVDALSNASFADTYESSRSMARIVIWTGMLLEVCILYVLVYTSVDTFVGYPENQFLSTPWTMLVDTFLMILVVPLTFLCFRNVFFSIYGGGVLVSILVMDGWILCGNDVGMDSDTEILTRVNRVRQKFDLDALTTDDNLFFGIKYLLVSIVIVIVPLWLFCTLVEYYLRMNGNTKNLREEYEDEYVRELLHAVPRGMSTPVVKGISKRTVRLTWSMPQKGSKSTRSFRILQRTADLSTPDTFVESVVCHDTQVWSQVSKIPGLVSAIEDRKLLKKINIVRFYVVSNMKPGKLYVMYSWSVQPLNMDDSKRRGIASKFTSWVEVSKMKPKSLKERLFGPPNDVLNIDTIIPKKYELESNKNQEDNNIHDSNYSHLEMMDWFKNFMIPALFDSGPNHHIEHPHANTSWKRFTFGNNFLNYIPFRVQIVTVFVLFVLIIQVSITGIISQSIYDSISDKINETETKESALLNIQNMSSLQCDLLSTFDPETVAASVCESMASGPPDLNCSEIGSLLNVSVPQAIITRCESGNATALWLLAWPELEADSYDAYSALCVPDDSVLLLKLYQIQTMCSAFTLVNIFPSSSDWEEARSPLSEGLVVGSVVASFFTAWFLYAYLVGVSRNVHLLREGKLVIGFRYRDVQKMFGSYYQSTFIGAVLSFYLFGNGMCTLLWYLVSLLFSWEVLVDNVLKPLLEWLFYYMITFTVNMTLFQYYVFSNLTCDGNFFHHFKRPNLYFMIDLCLTLYFIPYMAMCAAYKLLYGVCILIGLMFRMDITNYGEGLEGMDSGFVATMAMIAMNERVNNPVLRVFIRLLLKSRGDGSSAMVKWGERKRKARARWLLAYTLVKNPGLIKFRRLRGKEKYQSLQLRRDDSKTDEESISKYDDEGDETV